jgi:threonine dehydrogenase-like Zn-dependent dehydrogenase
MKATVLRAAGDVEVVNAPDPIIQEPTDAIVHITAAAICGSDLHPTVPRRPGRRNGSDTSSSASLLRSAAQ